MFRAYRSILTFKITEIRSKKLRNQKFQSSITNTAKRSCMIPIFFYPDFTVGLGVAPNLPCGSWAVTTGREINPALKILFYWEQATMIGQICQ